MHRATAQSRPAQADDTQAAMPAQGASVREVTMVQSVHFEFLRERRPYLADLAAFAERYAEPDPPSALLKLRSFAERVVEAVYDGYQLPQLLDANLNDLLLQDTFRQIVPVVVQDKLHFLRRKGNRAAHAGDGTTETALTALSEAFDLARWLHGFIDGQKVADLGKFDRRLLQVEPTKG
ncbi:MAG: DUF4145 domain-containing protein, partial [Myxococcota bacterium]